MKLLIIKFQLCSFATPQTSHCESKLGTNRLVVNTGVQCKSAYSQLNLQFSLFMGSFFLSSIFASQISTDNLLFFLFFIVKKYGCPCMKGCPKPVGIPKTFPLSNRLLYFICRSKNRSSVISNELKNICHLLSSALSVVQQLLENLYRLQSHISPVEWEYVGGV